MAAVSIALGTSGRLSVSADAGVITITNPPYWQQRLTPAEARRLGEALQQAAQEDE